METDRKFLTERAYGTDERLAARQAIYTHSRTRSGDFFAEVLSRVPWVGDEVVIDVGCGNGRYLDELLRSHSAIVAIGLDISEGMLRTVRASSQPPSAPRLVVADAQALPLRTASVDVALLMHMLFHLPNIAQGLSEVDRVLRRDGFVLVSMPGPGHLAQLSRLLMDSIAGARGAAPPADALQSPARSRVPDALRRQFRDVEPEILRGALSIPDAEVVARYIDSVQGPDFDAMLPDPTLWGAVVASARHKAAALIKEAGAFEVDTAVSLFRCRAT